MGACRAVSAAARRWSLDFRYRAKQYSEGRRLDLGLHTRESFARARHVTVDTHLAEPEPQADASGFHDVTGG